MSQNSTVVSVCPVSFDLARLFSLSVAVEKNSVAHHSVKVRQRAWCRASAVSIPCSGFINSLKKRNQ